MKIYDLSPPLCTEIAVWPGDATFRRQTNLRISQGASVNLSSMSLSLHSGSHADAPWHFDDDGASMEQADLSAYVGPCRLIEVNASETISPEALREALGSAFPPRLLIRCNPDFDPMTFPKRFVHFSQEAARMLGQGKVRLAGLDAPSVDFVDSKELPCHRIFGRQGTVILENLVLQDVPVGEYELIALPLKIVGGDASPIRAILRTL